MADSKISALPASTTPLAGTEVLPIVQSSATKQVSVANLTAGRAVATAALSATGIVLTTDATDASSTTAASMKTAGGLAVAKKIYVGDNIVPATAAKGINFTANTSAAGMTSKLLNDYEEGTWTAAFNVAGGSVTINPSYVTGRYTKVGRLVTVTGLFVASAASSPSGNFYISGLPFVSGSNDASESGSGLYFCTTNAFTGTPYTVKQQGNNRVFIQYTDTLGGLNGSGPLFKAGTEIKICVSYMV